MMERFKSPLAVIVVGRPKSPDWWMDAESDQLAWNFFEDLFRCLSYNIGDPHAGNPSIPVYYSIGDFDPSAETSQPPLIGIAETKCAVVLVLFDAPFLRATASWNQFFNELRNSATKVGTKLLFVTLARTDDGRLRQYIQRLGLGTTLPIYGRAGGDRPISSPLASGFFKINAMIAAIQALFGNTESEQKIEIFISYAKRDGEILPRDLRNAFDEYPGIRAVVDSMAFNPGASVDASLIEKKLATASCVVVCQTASYSQRVWCQREVLLAKKGDVPIIVVEMLNGLERRGSSDLENCPRLRLAGGIDGHVEEVVELAVSEILRIAYHRARCAAMLVPAGLDPRRVEILVRTPDPLRIFNLVASNSESTRVGRRQKDLVLHPDPPLREHELDTLRLIGPTLCFITPSTIFLANDAK